MADKDNPAIGQVKTTHTVYLDDLPPELRQRFQETGPLLARIAALESELKFVLERTKDSEALARAATNAKMAEQYKRERDALQAKLDSLAKA